MSQDAPAEVVDEDENAGEGGYDDEDFEQYSDDSDQQSTPPPKSSKKPENAAMIAGRAGTERSDNAGGKGKGIQESSAAVLSPVVKKTPQDDRVIAPDDKVCHLIL